MDTSLDRGQDNAHETKHNHLQSDEPAPVPQDAQAVLERPRDEEGRASVVDRKGKELELTCRCHFSSASVS